MLFWISNTLARDPALNLHSRVCFPTPLQAFLCYMGFREQTVKWRGWGGGAVGRRFVLECFWDTYTYIHIGQKLILMSRQREKLINNKISEDSASSIMSFGVGVGLWHCPKLGKVVRLLDPLPSIGSQLASGWILARASSSAVQLPVVEDSPPYSGRALNGLSYSHKLGKRVLWRHQGGNQDNFTISTTISWDPKQF